MARYALVDQPGRRGLSGGAAATARSRPAEGGRAGGRGQHRLAGKIPAQRAAFVVIVSACVQARRRRSEEHTSELQSLMRISYAVFCLKKKTNNIHTTLTKDTIWQ